LTLSQAIDDYTLAAYGSSAAIGDLLYRGGSGWTKLPAGTAGQSLKTNGPGSAPYWADGSQFVQVGSVAISGTSTLVTGIPAGRKRITIIIEGLKAGVNSFSPTLRVGTSAGILSTAVYTKNFIENSVESDGINPPSYPVIGGAGANDTCFRLNRFGLAQQQTSDNITQKIVLERIGNTNNWHMFSISADGDAPGSPPKYLRINTGIVRMPGDLDRIQYFDYNSHPATAGTLSLSHEA
jgi:hypothetical protein